MNPYLSNFCSQDIHRPNLQTPWHYAGHTYATDGRTAIRVPTTEPDSPLEVFTPGQEKPTIRPSDKIENLFTDLKNRELLERQIPALPAAEQVPCPSCRGNGYSRRCDRCHGTGEVTCPTCGHDHECSECNGQGRVLTSSQSGMPCADCAGTGKKVSERPVKIGNGWVNEKLLARFLPLPGLRMFQPKSLTECSDSPFYLTFTDGEGILMPRRPPCEEEQPSAIQ